MDSNVDASGPGKDKGIAAPLYARVREQLRTEVAQMAPGVMIAPEQELERRFGVSRITVRKAIDDLVAEGLLRRQQGRGTFVEAARVTHQLNTIASWTEQLAALGYTPGTRGLALMRIAAPRRLVQAMDLALDEELILIRRVRLTGAEPVSIMTNYIPSRLVPDFENKFRGYESLYAALHEQYGLVPAQAIDTVEARAATDTESAILKIEPWAPVLTVSRLSRLETGVPLEFTTTVSRADSYKYQVALQGRMRNS